MSQDIVYDIAGDTYVLSSAGMLFLVSMIVICILLSIVFFIRLLCLSFQVDTIENRNEESFDDIRDWILLIINDMSDKDKEFKKKVKKLGRKIQNEKEKEKMKIEKEDTLPLQPCFPSSTAEKTCEFLHTEDDSSSSDYQEEQEEEEEEVEMDKGKISLEENTQYVYCFI